MWLDTELKIAKVHKSDAHYNLSIRFKYQVLTKKISMTHAHQGQNKIWHDKTICVA